MAKDKVEKFVERIRSELGNVAEEVSVEWSQYEATVTLSLGDYLYVILVVSWYEGEHHLEIIVGDENGVIQPHHIDRMDLIADIVKRVGTIYKQIFQTR